MKYIFFILILVFLSSCKKNYACYGSETVFYKWSSKNANGVDLIVESQQNFVVRESCINCSKKDVDDIGEIMAEFLVDMENDYEKPFNDEYDRMHSKSIENYIITCQKK